MAEFGVTVAGEDDGVLMAVAALTGLALSS